MAKMTSDEICKLLDIFIGETEPWADSTVDAERYENLNTLIDICFWAIHRLYIVSKYRTSPYWSSKEIGEKAYSAMMDLKAQCEELESEVKE